MKKVSLISLQLGAALAILVCTSGCMSVPADAPETVSQVELPRYAGRWYEIASYPVFFNRGLTGVTAEYGVLPDGRVSVLNRGFKDALDGPESSIQGKARVVDPNTNSKLAVRFDQFPNNLFEGDYWIVVLDPDYQFAAVSDPRRYTLFILSRTPQMEESTYDNILGQLESNGFDLSKLKKTEQTVD